MQSKLNEAIAFSESMGVYHKKRNSTAEGGEKLMQDAMSAMRSDMHSRNIEEYSLLVNEPYFTRCDVFWKARLRLRHFILASSILLKKILFHGSLLRQECVLKRSETLNLKQ